MHHAPCTPHLFRARPPGEIAELKEELASLDKYKKKEAVKKVIAAMTVGKDVSMLFPAVCNNMQVGAAAPLGERSLRNASLDPSSSSSPPLHEEPGEKRAPWVQGGAACTRICPGATSHTTHPPCPPFPRPFCPALLARTWHPSPPPCRRSDAQTDDLELKKLVYLYLINYAKTQPDLAIMAVNTFVKVRRADQSPAPAGTQRGGREGGGEGGAPGHTGSTRMASLHLPDPPPPAPL